MSGSTNSMEASKAPVGSTTSTRSTVSSTVTILRTDAFRVAAALHDVMIRQHVPIGREDETTPRAELDVAGLFRIRKRRLDDNLDRANDANEHGGGRG